jgi:hypothetical protein
MEHVLLHPPPKRSLFIASSSLFAYTSQHVHEELERNHAIRSGNFVRYDYQLRSSSCSGGCGSVSRFQLSIYCKQNMSLAEAGGICFFGWSQISMTRHPIRMDHVLLRPKAMQFFVNQLQETPIVIGTVSRSGILNHRRQRKKRSVQLQSTRGIGRHAAQYFLHPQPY